MRPFRREADNYTLYGAIFGLCFPILATLLRLLQAGHGDGALAAVLRLQRTDPLLWIIDTAPLFLGLFARFAGIRQDRLQGLVDSLDEQVRARTAQLAASLAAQEAASTERALILEHSDQGLVPVAADGRMSPEHSAVLVEWLGPYAAGQFIWDYLFPSDAVASRTFELGWAALGEGHLPLPLLLEQLPQRVLAGGRTMKLAYRPVTAPAPGFEGPPARVLVILSDVSAEVARERLEGEQRESLEVSQRLLQNRPGFRDFYRQAERLLLRIAKPGLDSAELRRAVHTLKGDCATYGLRSMATLCHEVETRLGEEGALPPEELERLRARWEGLARRLGPLIGFAISERIEVSESELLSLHAALEAGEGKAELLGRLSAWRATPLQSKLEHLAAQARELGQRLGRPGLEVTVRSDEVRVAGDEWTGFFSALGHVVRNAVDHGIEDPERRLVLGKPERGRLTLVGRLQGRSLFIEVRDDGRGIDWERLLERARGRGMTSLEDRLEALFADGVSTRDEVSEISGRGVGLAAARESCLRLGGTVDVTSVPGVGTSFRFLLPYEGATA